MGCKKCLNENNFFFYFFWAIGKMGRMGQEYLPPNLGVPTLNSRASTPKLSRVKQYGKLTVRHHVFRNYVSPNQTCPVLEFLDFKVD